MNYEVTWLKEAEDELAALWLDASIRQRVTAAAAAIDRRLGLNGPDEGESRSGDHRVVFERPLVVTFVADILGRAITVTHVGRLGR